MIDKDISWLGEVAAISANRAIRNGDRAASDQNRGQFVSMVKDSLSTIPVELRGEEVNAFLEKYANGAYAK